MNNPAYNFLFALTGNFELTNIQAGMNDYDIYTCIKFVPRDNSNIGDKYIDIVREGGCWSFVGNTGAPSQKVSLGANCANVGKHKQCMTI